MQEEEEDTIPGVDGGVWAWLTMVACFFSLFLSGTFTFSAAILHIELLHTYQENDAYTSLVGAVFSSLLYLFGPIASVMINMTSCRTTHCLGGCLYVLSFTLSFFATSLDYLLFTYGILGGIGTGLVATSHLVVAAFRFRKYLGYVVGLQVTGAGISLMISGPLVQGLVNMYGLKGAFLVLGAIGSHQILFGLMMKPSILEIRSKQFTKENTEMYTDKEGSKNRRCCPFNCIFNFNFGIFKQKSFVMILISTFVWHLPASTLQLHLLNYSVTEGSTRSQAALIQTMVGVGSTTGRLLTGVLLGKGKASPLLLEFGMLGVLGIMTLLFPLFSDTFTSQSIYAVIYGVYMGGLITLFSPLCFSYLRIDQIATAIGVRYFIGGLSYIAGPPLTGLILDKGGSYATSFYISGLIFITAAFLDLFSTKWSAEEEEFENKLKMENGSLLSQSIHSVHVGAVSSQRSVHSIQRNYLDSPHTQRNYLDSPHTTRSLRSLQLLERRGIDGSSHSLQSHHSFHPPQISKSMRSLYKDVRKDETVPLKTEKDMVA